MSIANLARYGLGRAAAVVGDPGGAPIPAEELAYALVHDTTDYASFPTPAFTWAGVTYLVARRGTDHHNGGKLYQYTSRDYGATWDSGTVIFEDAIHDVRAAGGGINPATGTVCLFVARYTGENIVDMRMLRSPDRMHYTDLGAKHAARVVSAYGHMRIMPSGRLVMPWYEVHSGNQWAKVSFSDNDGRTWGGDVTLNDESVSVNETDIIYVGGATDSTSQWLAVSRKDPANQHLRMFKSEDGFVTVTDLGDLTFPTSQHVAPSFVDREDGKIVLISSKRSPPGAGGGLYYLWADSAAALVSNRAWSDAGIIAPHVGPPSWSDFGYPSPLHFPAQPNRSFVVWYAGVENDTDLYIAPLAYERFRLAFDPPTNDSGLYRMRGTAVGVSSVREGATFDGSGGIHSFDRGDGRALNHAHNHGVFTLFAAIRLDAAATGFGNTLLSNGASGTRGSFSWSIDDHGGRTNAMRLSVSAGEAKAAFDVRIEDWVPDTGWHFVAARCDRQNVRFTIDDHHETVPLTTGAFGGTLESTRKLAVGGMPQDDDAILIDNFTGDMGVIEARMGYLTDNEVEAVRQETIALMASRGVTLPTTPPLGAP